MIAVIAGNMRQYEQWCRENDRHPNDPEVFFVTSPDKLRGKFNLTFAWYGLWYQRSDADEIRQIAEYMTERDKPQEFTCASCGTPRAIPTTGVPPDRICGWCHMRNKT